MMAVTAAVIGAWAVIVAWLALDQAARLGRIGADLDLYVTATRRWIDGGGFYLSHQLAGPYVITDGDILYPPTTIPLFLPFVVLPSILFLILPLAIIGWVVIRHRPAPWTWPLMVACLAFTPTLVKIIHLNPFLWAAAALALGTIHAWPGALAVLKPSLAMFAIFGVWKRSWWVAAGAVGIVALAFAPMWPDYISVLRNSSNENGLLYSLQDIPLMLVPLIAWIGRSRRDPIESTLVLEGSPPVPG